MKPSPTAAAAAAPAAAQAVVDLRDVHKHYRVGREIVKALDGISFAVPAGGFVAVMGASGSGKSTLLNILGCLDRPTLGGYWLDGVNVAALDDDALSGHRLRRLGFIFQSFHLIPQLTVHENIALPLFYLGHASEATEQRVLELAEAVGVANRLRHRPSELSGGQRQRVAIARALANDPAVILADEPTGNLDSATSRQIMDLLLDLNRQGRTVLMVTHEEDVAACTRGRITLRDGRVKHVSGEVLA